MKAIVCEQYGPPQSLKLKEVEDLRANEDEVVIAVKACGVNFPDTLIIQGLYQFKPNPPFTPGSDVAGIVMAVGDKVENLKKGDRVFGMAVFGGFAEQIVLPATLCFKIPGEMEFPLAASFMLAYGTSYHALKDRGTLEKNETLVVLGASGGVGLAAVELGAMMGAKVIACVSREEKMDMCRKYGAHEVINYSEGDLKKKIRAANEGRPIDLIYDPVGGDYAEPALRTLGWKGRYLVVGFAAGGIPKIPLNLPLLKGCSIVGVFFGDFLLRKNKSLGLANNLQLLEWVKEGKLKPHIHKKYPLEKVPDALQDIMDRNVIGKAVVIIDS